MKKIAILITAALAIHAATATDWKRGVAIDGAVRFAPDKTASGYYPIVDICPAPIDDEHQIAVDHWENIDGKCICIYKQVEIPRESARVWTPLAIKRACGDKWATVKAALQAADIYEDFVMAQELREDDAAFQAGIAWAKSVYGEAAVEEVLARAAGGAE